MADATESTPALPFSLLGKVEGAKKAFLAGRRNREADLESMGVSIHSRFSLPIMGVSMHCRARRRDHLPRCACAGGQTFGVLGGMRQVRELEWDGAAVRVDGDRVCSRARGVTRGRGYATA